MRAQKAREKSNQILPTAMLPQQEWPLLPTENTCAGAML